MVISEVSVLYILPRICEFQFKTGTSLAKGHQDSQGLKDLPQEEKLRLVQHGEDTAFRGSWRMEPVLPGGMMRDNGQKLKKDKVRLALRKNFFTFWSDKNRSESQESEEIAKRNCAVLEGFQDQAAIRIIWTDLTADPAFSWRLDWINFRGIFQPELSCDLLILFIFYCCLCS